MNVGVIGVGNIGGTLARHLATLGHKVSIASARGPERLADLATGIGATPVSVLDAARGAEVKSGTGHGSYLTFASRERVKLEGEAKHWDIVGDSGNVKTRAFCSECGSPVYLMFSAMPDLFTVHAASLDDPRRYEPQAVTYTLRGYVWDWLDPAVPKFEKMPPT